MRSAWNRTGQSMKRFWFPQALHQNEFELQNETWAGAWNAPQPSVLQVCVRSHGAI